MPCNNVKRAVVSAVFIYRLWCIVSELFSCIIYHILEISGFFYCIIIVIIIIIIIIVIIIKHFHQLKTVKVTIRNLEWLNSIGCVILFWSIFYVNTKNIG